MNAHPPLRPGRPGPPGYGSLARPIGPMPGAPSQLLEKGWTGVKRIYQEVDWSVSYIAFLMYFVIVITYRFPGASWAIGTAVVGLVVEKGQRRLPYWLGWLLLFLIWGTVSYTQSQFPRIAWEDGVVEYAKLWLIMLVAVNVLTSAPRIRFFLIFFLFLYATHPVRGALFNWIVYSATVEGRVAWNGIWSNPNDMAALTFLALGIGAGLLKDRSDLVRKAALLSVGVMSCVILMTRSRGGFLAFAVFAILAVVANRKQAKALLVVAVLGAAAILAAPQDTFTRFFDLTNAVAGEGVETADDSGSAEQRLEIWQIARRIIVDRPVFGVGLAAYNYEHARYARNSAQTRIGGGRRDTHSTYLRVTAETGFLGATVFFVPFLLVIARARRVRKKYAATLVDLSENVRYVEAGLIAYLFCAIFGSYSATIFLWLAVGLLAILTEELRRSGLRTARPTLRRGPPPPRRARLPQPVGTSR